MTSDLSDNDKSTKQLKKTTVTLPNHPKSTTSAGSEERAPATTTTTKEDDQVEESNDQATTTNQTAQEMQLVPVILDDTGMKIYYL